jgi:choline kinase
MQTKAVLLAAGRGTRLLPLSADTPKTLLPVGGKAILDYILERVAAAGIPEAVIATGHRADRLMAHVGSLRPGLSVRYVHNPVYDRTNSTYSLWLAREEAGDDFVVINADTLFSRDILRFLVRSDHEIALAVDDTIAGALPEEAMKVTVVDGRITDASKTIPPERAHGDAIGLYRFRAGGARLLWDELGRLVAANVLDQLFTYAVKRLMPVAAVYPVSTRGLAWIEVDDVNDLRRAEGVVARMLAEEGRA